MTVPAYRGQVVQARLYEGEEPKLFLVVSNNRRNSSRLGSVLAVRLTTTVKADLPSIVLIPASEDLTGRVLCDDILTIYLDEIIRRVGGLSPTTMRLVDEALKVALSLD